MVQEEGSGPGLPEHPEPAKSSQVYRRAMEMTMGPPWSVAIQVVYTTVTLCYYSIAWPLLL
jgi:hypothetical protein